MKNGYRVVLFEGGDAAGKTTLKRAFDKKVNYYHQCCDRFLVSSLVYNKVYERHQEIEDAIWDDLFNFIETFDALIVFVLTDPEIAWQRVVIRGDEMTKSKEEAIALYKGYNSLYEKLRTIGYSKYVMEVNGNDPVEQSIEKILNRLGDQDRLR
jgi:thymidylate kinase